jgi:hypothetical protein
MKNYVFRKDKTNCNLVRKEYSTVSLEIMLEGKDCRKGWNDGFII